MSIPIEKIRLCADVAWMSTLGGDGDDEEADEISAAAEEVLAWCDAKQPDTPALQLAEHAQDGHVDADDIDMEFTWTDNAGAF